MNIRAQRGQNMELQATEDLLLGGTGLLSRALLMSEGSLCRLKPLLVSETGSPEPEPLFTLSCKTCKLSLVGTVRLPIPPPPLGTFGF